MYIKMKNDSGVTKQVKCGFSWTTLFFGWIPSLLRGDIVSAIKLFLIGNITLGIYKDYKSYNINQDYYNSLTEKGYKSDEEFILQSNPIGNIIVGILIGLKVLLIIACILGSIFVASLDQWEIDNYLTDNEYTCTEDLYDDSSLQDSSSDYNTPNPKHNRNMFNGNVYSDWVTEKDLNTYYDEVNSKLDQLTVKYGDSYRTYGLILDGDPENAQAIAQDYFDYLDSVLNQEWGNIRLVLHYKEFDKLVEEEKAWILERDKIAKQASDSATDFKEVTYLTTQGKETEKRIIELRDRFLNTEN